MSEKRWPIPEGYYERIANSTVNKPFHTLISQGAMKVVALAHGNLVLFAPQSVLDNRSNGVVTGTHRSKKDTPLFVNATERVGLRLVRPYAKDQIFYNWLMRAGYHALGAFAVNRDKPDTKGIKLATHTLLYRGQSLMNFVEEERIFQNIRKVADVKKGGILAAVTARLPIFPLVFAGVGIEKEEVIDEENGGVKFNVLYKDRSALLGMGKRIVGLFGEPILTTDFVDGERPADMNATRADISAAREIAEVLKISLQQNLDLAYDIRESGLYTPRGLIRVDN